MMNALKKRLKALEAKSGHGYKPFTLAYYDGPPEDNEKEVATAEASAEANGMQLWAVFFISPQEQFRNNS